MAYFEFPHTRTYDGDLGYILKKISELVEEYNNFVAKNSITFADPQAWDITSQYPAFCIVSDYDNGISYISKKPVPAGITLNNADYWSVLGPLMVDAIARTEIADILNFIANICETGTTATAVRSAGEYVVVSGILYKTTAPINVGETYTSGYNVTPISIEDMIDDKVGAASTTLTGKIDTVKGYRDFTTRKFLCISDSYGLTPTEGTSWIAKLKEYLDIPSANFFRSQENASGFIGLVPTTFQVQAQTVIGAMSSQTRSEITDVIIGGGYNDATALRNGSTETDMRNAIVNCLNYIRTNLPNAIIYVFMPGWNIDATTHASLRGITNIYQQFIFNVDRCCYIDHIDWLHREALLDATKYHPNAIGAYCIAKSIASKLLGGDAFCDLALDSSTGFIAPTFTASADITNYTFNNLRQTYTSGYAYMTWESIIFELAAALTDGAGVTLADFTDSIMSGGTFLNGYIATATIIGYGTVEICIYNNKLRMINLTGATLPANTAFNIAAGSISGPVML